MKFKLDPKHIIVGIAAVIVILQWAYSHYAQTTSLWPSEMIGSLARQPRSLQAILLFCALTGAGLFIEFLQGVWAKAPLNLWDVLSGCVGIVGVWLYQFAPWLVWPSLAVVFYATFKAIKYLYVRFLKAKN
jgi:hypothetical protein